MTSTVKYGISFLRFDATLDEYRDSTQQLIIFDVAIVTLEGKKRCRINDTIPVASAKDAASQSVFSAAGVDEMIMTSPPFRSLVRCSFPWGAGWLLLPLFYCTASRESEGGVSNLSIFPSDSQLSGTRREHHATGLSRRPFTDPWDRKSKKGGSLFIAHRNASDLP